MALQESVIQLTGGLGNLSFYKTEDGYLARKKNKISAERLKFDPAFARTRENNAEFGRAGLGSKLLRNALRTMLLNCADKRMNSRLTREMLKVVQSDPTSERGMRSISAGDLNPLLNFDFNVSSKFFTTFFGPFQTDIDRASGNVMISLQDFVPINTMAYPEGATHFVLKAAAAELDFDNNKYVMSSSASAPADISAQVTPAFQLTQAVTAGSTLPIIAVFGIEFFQFVNNNQYALKNGAFNALAIVGIDQ
jgi:hypothetical protein